MKKNIKKLFLAAGLLAITGALLTGCGSKKKNAEEESVIKISTAPEPTATPDPKTVDPDAVTSTDNADSAGEDTSSDEDNDTSGSGGEEGAMDGE